MLNLMKLHAVNRSTLFLFGCLLYFGGSAILNSDTSPILIIRFLQLTGLSFIFYNFFFLVKKQNSRLTSFCVCFFVILGVFIMIRGNYLTVMSVLNKVYDRMGLMLYLTPLIYFILSENVLKKMFSLFFLMSLLFVVLILLSYRALFTEFGFVVISQLTAFLGSTSIILFYFIRSFGLKYKIVIFISLGLLFIFATLMARRGLVLDIFIAFFLNIVGVVIFGDNNSKQKIKILFFIFFLSLIAWRGYGYLSTTLFSNLIEKGMTDTRSQVEFMFIDDVFSNVSDVFWGRGIDGVYYAPGIESSGEEYRNLIETVFLHIILKGGILFLIPFLVFLICAICKGFASKSYFSHQSALFLVHFIVSLYPGSPFDFCPKYLFVWVAVWSIYTNQKNNIFR